MNLYKFTKPLKLGQRGIAHFMVPLVVVLLVAVTGTYLLVASHADAKPVKAISASVGKPVAKVGAAKPKPAYMLVYSEGLSYTKVKIGVFGNAPASSLNCGGALTAANGYSVVHNLPGKSGAVYPPLKVNCTVPAGGTPYSVIYATSGSFNDASSLTGVGVSVPVTAGMCTYVHPNGNLDHQAPVGANGVCTNDTDTITPQSANLTLDVSPSKNGKALSGYAQLAIAGKDTLPKAACTGSVSVSIGPAGGGSTNFTNPLKYASKTSFVQTDGGSVTVSTCSADISKDGINSKGFFTAGSTYTISAVYTGNAYFNLANAAGGNVTLPAATTSTRTTTTPTAVAPSAPTP